MSERSRRSFLKSATVTGAVAGAVLLPAGLATAAASPQTRTEPDASGRAPLSGAVATSPIVAYVKDASSGKIAVMAGEHEFVHVDAQLAARLSQLAAQAPAA